METITIKEQEVCNREGRSFRLQVRPYKTTDNRIDGAVISLVDITLLKEHLTESQTALKYATSVADTLPLPWWSRWTIAYFCRPIKDSSGCLRLFPDKDVGSDLMTVLGGRDGKFLVFANC